MSEENQVGIPAIYPALDAVNKNLTAIGKDQKGYGYKFRGIDDVLNSVNPLFKENGIVVGRRNLKFTRTTRDVPDKNKKDIFKTFVEVNFKCQYVFTSTIDGSEFITEGFGEGQDSAGGDKACSMATSNSYKYVIFEMFNVATEEQKDSDQVTAETAKEGASSSFAKKGKGVKVEAANKESAPPVSAKDETAPEPEAKSPRFRKKKGN